MSPRAFNESLYREHFDELAAMSELRSSWLADWESSPDEVAGLEQRMEAHLDALVLGGSAATEVVELHARSEEPWSFYAWVAFACRVGDFEMLRDALVALRWACDTPDDDAQPVALRRAVAEALVHHVPDGWLELLAAELPGASAHVAPVLARCIGARCWEGAAEPLESISSRTTADATEVLRAHAQVPGTAVGPLLGRLGHDDPHVACTAATGALRRGDVRVFDALVKLGRASRVALPVAMASGPAVGPWLSAVVDEQPVQALVGLGLLGDPSALGVLIEHLEVEGHAGAAALGAYLITGAALAGPVFDAPEDDLDPLVLDLSAEIPRTLAPLSLEGSGISTNPTAWAAWLRTHRSRFRAGQRYRLGEVTSPLTDLAALSATRLPLWLRQCLTDEFVIRYGVSWTYQPSLLMTQQRQLVAWMTARLEDARQHFEDGAWYFQGRRVE